MTHHAYYIEGSLGEFDALKAELTPFVAEVHERFGIDEARKLVERASLKNFKETIFLVGASSITTEAQQALLKLFEEPQEGTVFYLLVPHGVLLPTLKSRMLEFAGGGNISRSVATKVKSEGDYSRFLRLSQKDRSDFITKFLKDDEGVKERTRELLDGLEAELYKKISDPKARAALGDISMVRDYLRDRSPSLKMLLEHLAVSLP